MVYEGTGMTSKETEGGGCQDTNSTKLTLIKGWSQFKTR